MDPCPFLTNCGFLPYAISAVNRTGHSSGPQKQVMKIRLKIKTVLVVIVLVLHEKVLQEKNVL